VVRGVVRGVVLLYVGEGDQEKEGEGRGK